MASLLGRILGRREPSSAQVARERLKLVLVTDRSDLSPDRLEQMQAEIIQVIKRYLEIDDTPVSIKLEQRERKTYLVADIALPRARYGYPDEGVRPLVGAGVPNPGADTKPSRSGAPPGSDSVNSVS